MTNTLENLSKSSNDKKIAGICAGFGKHTEIPTWLWRVIFISLIFLHGVGLVAYAALWFFMPPEKTDNESKTIKARDLNK